MTRIRWLPFFSILCSILLFAIASSLPVQYVIDHHAEECLYDKLEKGESFTISVFILAGSTLEAQVVVEGPVAPATAVTGLEIYERSFQHEKGDHITEEQIHFEHKVDFENFNNEVLEESDDAVVPPEDEAAAVAAEEDEPPRDGETAEEKRARRARERRRALEANRREERMKRNQKRKVRTEGKPFQETFKAPEDGWYQFCIEAQSSKVTVELDFRRERDYGGLEPKEGHVLTLEEHAVEEEEKAMEADTAAQEGITDEDFQSTKEKLKTLRRLLADIQSKQSQERHRLMVHSATNEHSHSRMVLSSLLETILFMLVTGYQVFTIRRWFQGAPALGR